MQFVDKTLSLTEIQKIQEEFGDYVKLTIDLENRRVVVGPELHADGEKLFLEKGGKQDNIWGGGIDLKDKIIDTTAVLNLRPRLDNESMEILDPERRAKFIEITKEIFKALWH
jgi:hypothetical protein